MRVVFVSGDWMCPTTFFITFIHNVYIFVVRRELNNWNCIFMCWKGNRRCVLCKSEKKNQANQKILPVEQIKPSNKQTSNTNFSTEVKILRDKGARGTPWQGAQEGKRERWWVRNSTNTPKKKMVRHEIEKVELFQNDWVRFYLRVLPGLCGRREETRARESKERQG